ncbi:MAG: Stp1/IreP family PP2C-type Ser/Thr phosphatase [Clostridia bacterium]|nr:Stp1/IreP family PP2C-type Ser/Thr phosphatase [Clostridia bacterium]
MKISGLSDRGMVRKNNQDSYAFRETDKFVLGVVCDGMGGAAAGNKASALAIKRITDKTMADMTDGVSPNDIKSILRGVVRAANRHIYDTAQNNRAYLGMGTTAVAFIYMKEMKKAFFVNVGDSRAYILRDGALLQITQDHSLVFEMLQKGQITKDEARNHPNRNIITRAIGTDEQIHPDTFEAPIKKRDKILLCSDGLTNMLTDEEILTVLSSDGDMEKTVAELVNRANIAGGADNVTALLAYFDEEGSDSL